MSRAPSNLKGYRHEYTLNADRGIAVMGGAVVGVVLDCTAYTGEMDKQRYALDIGRPNGAYVRVTFSAEDRRAEKLAAFYKSFARQNPTRRVRIYKNPSTGTVEAAGHTITNIIAGAKHRTLI